MTCVSDKSGIASSLVLLREYQPSIATTPVKRKTRNLLRAQISMIRFIIANFPLPSAPVSAKLSHRSPARRPRHLLDERRHRFQESSDQTSFARRVCFHPPWPHRERKALSGCHRRNRLVQG